MKLRNLASEALSTNLSMLGSGQASFGHALFKYVKSTHILHYPKDLGTITTLANHVVKCISFMNPAISNFTVSCVAAFCFLIMSFLFFCGKGRTFGSIANLWKMIFGSIPSVSSGAHANRSELDCRRLISSIFMATGSSRPTNVNFCDVAPIWIF